LSDRTEQGSYGQFCPVAMAAEVICSRWTALVVRELLCGSTRFNDLRRGVPRMSPTLLSKRLKELEEAGVIAVKKTSQKGVVEYKLTEAGEELRGIVMSLGVWGQRWVESSLSLKNLDPSLLMWDMRRNLAPAPIPGRRCTVKFDYPELSAGRKSWWLVVENGEVDLCRDDPGYEVTLIIESTVRALTEIWTGDLLPEQAVERREVRVQGGARDARSVWRWIGASVFAPTRREVLTSSRSAGQPPQPPP